MAHRVGLRTVALEKPVYVESFFSAVGPKEAEGPLSDGFHKKYNDVMLEEESFEKAESRLQQTAVENALARAGLSPSEIDVIFAGDLLNQCIGSSYGLRDFGIPFVGLYGACSTFALGLIMAAGAVEGGGADKAVAVTSSHFCSSERQFRFPLEYGGQRTPSAQWTVTGSGASVVGRDNALGIKITHYTVGKIVDLDVTDMSNMGAAMAPAAADTIISFLSDTGTVASDYDLILTGDLGFIGSDLLLSLMEKAGSPLNNHNDCGKMIFERKEQDVHSGGSGCGCSASVMCSEIFQKMYLRQLKKVLFCATGALMSPTSSLQGESIPSIAHLISLSIE